MGAKRPLPGLLTFDSSVLTSLMMAGAAIPESLDGARVQGKFTILSIPEAATGLGSCRPKRPLVQFMQPFAWTDPHIARAVWYNNPFWQATRRIPMENILWIGKPSFAPCLEACGFASVRILSPPCGAFLSWDDISRAGVPELLVVAPQWDTPSVLGVEDFPCLTIFAPDEANRFPWHNPYAQAFDFCIAPYENMATSIIGSRHTPDSVWIIHSFADDFPVAEDLAPATFRPEILIWPSADPVAVSFLAEHGLSAACRYAEPDEEIEAGTIIFYPGTDFSDAAMFNHMARGACVIAPRKGSGIEKLFVDGEQWVGYAPNEAGDAVYRIEFLLAHPELVVHVAEKAREAVYAGHRPEHRAWNFTDKLFDAVMMGAVEMSARRRSMAEEVRRRDLAPMYAEMARKDTSPVRRQILAQAGSAAFSSPPSAR